MNPPELASFSSLQLYNNRKESIIINCILRLAAFGVGNKQQKNLPSSGKYNHLASKAEEMKNNNIIMKVVNYLMNPGAGRIARIVSWYLKCWRQNRSAPTR